MFYLTDRHATGDDDLTEFDDSLHGGEILDAGSLTTAERGMSVPRGS
jgi:hypothetical protein